MAELNWIFWLCRLKVTRTWSWRPNNHYMLCSTQLEDPLIPVESVAWNCPAVVEVVCRSNQQMPIQSCVDQTEKLRDATGHADRIKCSRDFVSSRLPAPIKTVTSQVPCFVRLNSLLQRLPPPAFLPGTLCKQRRVNGSDELTQMSERGCMTRPT